MIKNFSEVIEMLFFKSLSYSNKKNFNSDIMFLKIKEVISSDIPYRAKKENNLIRMKPINNLILYNSFKPIITILCSADSITLKVHLKKTSIFSLIFSSVFVLFLDLMTAVLKLYLIPEWLLALLIAHIVVIVLGLCAKLLFCYFYKKIDNWFNTEVINEKPTID